MSRYCHIKVETLTFDDALDDREINDALRHVDGIESQFEQYVVAAGVDSSCARLDPLVLQTAMFDYEVDVKRLKGFHSIDHINSDKIKAYECAWLLKRKPIQLLRETPSGVFINEKFVAWLLMKHLVGDLENADSYESIREFYQAALYHLIYRETDPKTLELMIVAFKSALEVARQNARK